MALEIGKTYNLSGIGKVKIEKATEKGKAKSAVQLSTGKRVNFGDPKMRNAPGTERGDNYCSRSGSLNERGFNANTLSREDWECKGSKSKGAKDMAELVPVKWENLTPQQKYDTIMHDFEKGDLKTPDGKVITSRREAEAVAFRESGLK